MGGLIPLTDWAKREGIDQSTARHKAIAGRLETARKVGRIWLIDEEEKNLDLRLKENKKLNLNIRLKKRSI